jgi:hypothetical protein
MARQKKEIETEQHIVTVEDAKGLPALSAAATELAGADAVIMDSFDAIKAVGRIETAQFYATVAEKLIAETAINIREGKRYKGLPYKDENGNTRHVAHFDEFCQFFLGKSARRVQELMSNYNTLGPDLYEQAERIGFRQRDYNALKTLPADDRQIIGMAIEEENLDKALELMQHLVVKHEAYKDATEKQLTELVKSAESKDAVIQKKDQKLNELDHELERLKLDNPVFAHIDWPAAFKGYLDQLAITRKNVKHGLGSLDVIREAAMKIEPQSEAEEAALNQAREILATELVGVHNECAEMIAALGLSFDRSLGAYSEARINLLNV